MNYFGAMLDMSRNGVMNLKAIKTYIDYLSAFGYLRGKYTKKEI